MASFGSVPHVTNRYDHAGNLRGTIVVDPRIKIIDKMRKQLTYIECELMLPEPDNHVIQAHVTKILDHISEDFVK